MHVRKIFIQCVSFQSEVSTYFPNLLENLSPLSTWEIGYLIDIFLQIFEPPTNLQIIPTNNAIVWGKNIRFAKNAFRRKKVSQDKDIFTQMRSR